LSSFPASRTCPFPPIKDRLPTAASASPELLGRVFEVVKLWAVELDDRSVGNDGATSIFMVPSLGISPSQGHDPTKEVSGVFDLAPKSVYQIINAVVALFHQCTKVPERD